MKILVFGASNSYDSINRRFAISVSKYYKELDDQKDIIDLNDYDSPIYSKAYEKENGIPQKALDFAQKIDWADLIIISFAENNGNYNAFYKNMIDWVSRIKDRKIYQNKAVFLLATSPGGRGGQSVLQIATDRMPFDGAEVLETFSLPDFNNKFEDGKGVTDNLFRSQLEAKVRKTKRLMGDRLIQKS